MFGSKCVGERPFSTMKQANLDTEIEVGKKHRMMVAEASITGIPLTEICNKLLFPIV